MLGYSSKVASNGSLALFLYKRKCLTIDIMVLDVELFIVTIGFHFLTVEGSSFSPASLQGKRLIRNKSS